MLYEIKVHDKWGYIDQEGTIRIPPQYRYGGEFSEGLAAVHIEGRGEGVINTSGQVVSSPGHHSILPFKEGRARFWPTKNSGAGFMNASGETVIPPIYEQAQIDFNEGLVFAARDNVDCVMDRDGRVLHTCPRGSLRSGFSAGLVAKADPEGLIGYTDTQFKWYLRPQYREGSIFWENMAYVRLQSGEAAYIDTFGTVKFKGEFAIGNAFCEGIASVFVDGKAYVFVDRSGNRLFGRTFNSVGPFSEGLASVEFESGKIGYIDRLGNQVIPPILSDAYPFKNGIAQVYSGDDVGPSYIDKNGKFVWRHGRAG